MSASTIVPDPSTLALRFDHVTKVYCGSLKLARMYAFRDLVWPRRDRPSRLRKSEWLVLRDITFELKARETLLILGVSGSGKSALADLITKRRSPDVGTITRRGDVGLIAEGKYGQNPLMRLREYLRLMAVLQGTEAKDLTRRVDEILEWTGLTPYRDTMVFDLPKHLMKPVSRVGALLAEHDIYVFDNYTPFGNSELDERMAARFEEIQATRTCVVLGRGPHVPDHVDHVLILHGGEIIYSGEPAEAISVYDQFIDHARVVQKRRGAGSGRGGALHHQAIPPVDEALILIRDLLGAGGPTWSIDKALARLTTLTHPFLVGPCLTGASWEVLFWLPFLKWMRRQLGASPAAVAVSRGAVGSWYAPIASSFVDIYDLISPKDFEAGNEDRARQGALKQVEISPFEREVLDLAAAKAGVTGEEVLHPSLLLGLAAQIWRGRVELSELAKRAVYERLPDPGDEMALPADYMVACLNFTKYFPDVPENRQRVIDTILLMRERASVVVLGAHEWLRGDPRLPDGGRGIEVIDPEKDLRRRHQTEAAVIGRARAAIGTLNGAVTLAPFSGVPAICLHPTTGKMLEFNVGALRQAAEGLGETALLTAPMGSMMPAEMGRWLDGALEGRAFSHASGRV